jgi:hypothetical protein
MLMGFRQILLRLTGGEHGFRFVGLNRFYWTILLIFIESAKITDRVLKVASFSAVASGKPLAE